MNTSQLSQFVSPAIPEVLKFASTRQADTILQKRETIKIASDSVGKFSSNGTKTISFKIPAGRGFLDLSALRMLFTLEASAATDMPQDGCPIIRSIAVYVNGQLIEQISNYYSLFQNSFFYYSAHDSAFATQLTRCGFWSGAYGRSPKPSELFNVGAQTGVVSYNNGGLGNGYFSDSFEIPLSMLGLCRSKKLFPALLCNSIQIVVEIAPKEQAMLQVSTTGAIGTYAINDKPSNIGNPSDYSLKEGTVSLLCDSLSVADEYAQEVYRVAQEGSFSFVLDTFDFVSNICSSSLNNIVLSDAKTKMKDIYMIFKQNVAGLLTDNYYNPLPRRLQVMLGSVAFPSQALGGRSSGVDSDILLNMNEIYDSTLLGFNELYNVLAMGIVPFKSKDNGACVGGQSSANNYKIAVGNGVNSHTYCGERFMIGVNLEANLDSLMSGQDTKQTGGLITVVLELESNAAAGGAGAPPYPIVSSTAPAVMLCLLHFDRQIVFSKGAMYLLD